MTDELKSKTTLEELDAMIQRRVVEAVRLERQRWYREMNRVMDCIDGEPLDRSPDR